MVRMPSRVAVSGPMVEPHGRALFDTNSCVVDPGLAAGLPPDAGPDRVGGVALVGVDLEQRTVVQQRAVGRVVPCGVVRVDGVAGVGGQADRAGEGAVALVGPSAQRRRDPLQHVGRAGVRAAPLRDALPNSS